MNNGGDTYNSLMENALVARTLQGFKGSLNKFLEHRFSGHYKRYIIKFLDYFYVTYINKVYVLYNKIDLINLNSN